jgi:hypothetical protein
MATNPSHILIARNSARGGPNPAGLLSSPIETHAAASGIFRSGNGGATTTVIGSPPWLLEEVEVVGGEDAAAAVVPELALEEGGEIEVDPTFRENSSFPGRVKIIVESTTFWCASCSYRLPYIYIYNRKNRAHREVLYFASPFFEAILSGDWAETAGRPRSVSSVITYSQLPTIPDDSNSIGGSGGPADLGEATTEMEFAPCDPDADPDDVGLDVDEADPPRSDSGAPETPPTSEEDKKLAIQSSLEKLEGGGAGGAAKRSDAAPAPTPTAPTVPGMGKGRRASLDTPPPMAGSSRAGRRRRSREPVAVIVLKEERVRLVITYWFTYSAY